MKKLIALVCMLGLVLQFTVPAYAAGTADIAYGANSALEAGTLPEGAEEGPDEDDTDPALPEDETDPPQAPADPTDPADPDEPADPAQPEAPAREEDTAEPEITAAEDETEVYNYTGLAAALAAGGTVVLLNNISLAADQTVTVAADTQATLKSVAGKTFTIRRSVSLVDASLILVPAGASLTLENIILDGGGTADSHPLLRNTGTLTINSGTVFQNNNNATTIGGALLNDTGATATMNGGTITGNSADVGGGVYNAGTFKMNGGTIRGNTATSGTNGGGGVYNDATGIFEMAGGTIAGNTANKGGGVHNTVSTKFTMAGGTITGNTAELSGGGVFTEASGAGGFTMTDGLIDANSAFLGGGVYATGPISLGGGIIMQNSAVYGEELNISATATLSGTPAVGTPSGGLYFTGSRALVKAPQRLDSGAAIYIEGGDNTFFTWNTTAIEGGLASKASFMLVQGSSLKLIEYGPHLRLQKTTGTDVLAEIQNAPTNGTLTEITIGGTVVLNEYLTIPAGTNIKLKDGKLVRGTSMPADQRLIYIKEATTNVAATRLTLENVTVDGLGTPVTTPGALVLLEGGSQLNLLAGSVLRGGNTTNNGGAVYLSSAATGDHGVLTIDGGTITGNTAADGGGVYNSRGTVTLKSGAITGNTASSPSGGGGGGVYCTNVTATVTISGGVISGNTAADGGGLFVSGTAKMTAGAIRDNTARRNGGGVVVPPNSISFTLSGGAITGNTSNYGAGVYNNGSSFKMAGGTISGNTSSYINGRYGTGGGVYSSGSSSTGSGFEMTGGAITGNTSVSSGGGVCTVGSFTMAGGTIAGNTANNSGGEVSIESNGMLTLAPKAAITIGQAGGVAGIVIANASFIQLNGSLKAGSRVVVQNISSPADGALVVSSTVKLTAAQQKMFTLLMASYTLAPSADGKELLLGPAASLQNKVNAANPGDVIVLTGEVTLTSALYIRAGTDVVLTGGSLVGSNIYDYIVSVAAGATLTLKDITLDGAMYADSYIVRNSGTLKLQAGATLKNGGRGGVTNASGATLEMTGGVITGNSSSNGGGVYNSGTFKMSGGTITGNTASRFGGGVYNYDGIFLLSGGTITGNKSQATGDMGGGGVAQQGTNAEFTMTGGAITGNECTGTSYYGGGGVYVGGGSFTLSAGVISGNSSSRSAGGVYFGSANSTLTISGGAITGNIAASGGAGGLYAAGSGSTYTMTDGAITGNTASGGGGGVFTGTSPFTFSGGEISGNTAGGGGGVTISYGTFKMTGGTIANNTADGTGGGVSSGVGTFEMMGGAITNNIAGANGGGVYAYGLSGGTTIGGGAITGNTSGEDGGGMYISSGTFAMHGVAITGNTAAGKGGGVYEGTGAAFNISDGTIARNTAGTDGGGLYSSGGTATISGCTITRNTAGTNGGGVYIFRCPFTVADGAITGNKAANGGGVYLESYTIPLAFALRGGAITGNTAEKDGGGLYLTGSGAQPTISGGTISANTAGANGGGVYKDTTVTLAITGGAITGNTAQRQGGGVLGASPGIITMSGGTITGNAFGAAENAAGGDMSIATTFNYSGGVVGTPGTQYGIFHAGSTVDTWVEKDLTDGDFLLFENSITTTNEANVVAKTPSYYPDSNPNGNRDFMSSIYGAGVHYSVLGQYGAYRLNGDLIPTKLLYLDGGLGGFVLRKADPANDQLMSIQILPIPGYTFAGWNSKADGSGTTYTTGDVLPFPEAEEGPNPPARTLTLYAMWQPLVNNLVFYTSNPDDTLTPGVVYAPGASGNAATYTPGQTTPLAAPLYSGVDRRTFAGWYLRGDATQTLHSRINSAWRGDIELVALWGTEETPLPDDFSAGGTPPTTIALSPGGTNNQLAQWLAGIDTTAHNALSLYSSNPAVATVTSGGVVTAKQGGAATITVCRANMPTTAFAVAVQVTPKTGSMLAFMEDSTVVDKTVMQLEGTGGPWQETDFTANLGQRLALYNTVTSTYEPVTDLTGFAWTTDISGIVTVSNGVVTPTSVGTVTIDAARSGNNTRIRVTVVDKDADLRALALSADSLELEVGKSAALTATYTPQKPTLANTQWMVLADGGAGDVATIDQTGKVTATGPGKVTVRLAATDIFGTRMEAECDITVTQPTTGVKWNGSGLNAAGEMVLVRTAGEVYPTWQPKTAVQPANASDKGVAYTPLPPAAAKLPRTVAYYDDAAEKVTAGGKDGVATITATTTAGGQKAALKVRVVTPITDLKLLQKDKKTLAVDFDANTGTTTQLYTSITGLATVTPARSPSDKALTWKSSDPTVATVDSKGKVKAVGYGQATISVVPTNNYGGLSAQSVTITVKTPVKTFKIDQKNFSMLGGTRVQLTASANNGQAKAEGVTWSAAGGSLRVSSSGLVISNTVAKKTTVKVTAKHTATGKSSTISLTLLPGGYTEAVAVTLKKAPPALLTTGKSFAPTLNFTPAKPTNKAMLWEATASGVAADGKALAKIDLDRVAWLDRATGKLTGRLSTDYQEATVKVTGTALGGSGAKVSYTLYLVHPTAKVTLHSSAKAGAAAITALPLQESGIANLYAASNTSSPTSFTWKNSNAKVVQVIPNHNGTAAVITGLKGGSATITVTANDGTKKKATVKVTVTQQVRNVVLSGMKPKAVEGVDGTTGTISNGYDGYYGITEATQSKTVTLKPKLNVGYGAPKNKKVGYQVLAEYNADGTPAAAGRIVSLNAKKATVKGLAQGYALVRVYAEECPDKDFAATIPATSKVDPEFARNICLVKIT